MFIIKKGITNVFLDKWSLKVLLASAIEVYPRETMGLLWGVKSCRILGQKKKRCLSIKSVYPIQTVKRGYVQVDWGTDAAKNRLLNVVQTIKAGIIGEFHSHPKGGSSSSLSTGDLEYYLRETQEGREILGRNWIELVVRINQTKPKKRNEEPICGNYNYRKAERFQVNSISKTYDITLSAWFLKQKNKDEISSIQGIVWIEWPIV